MGENLYWLFLCLKQNDTLEPQRRRDTEENFILLDAPAALITNQNSASLRLCGSNF